MVNLLLKTSKITGEKDEDGNIINYMNTTVMHNFIAQEVKH